MAGSRRYKNVRPEKCRNIDHDDEFISPDNPGSDGSLNVTGEVRFFENLKLPATFKQNNPRAFAGILHATDVQPAFWVNQNLVPHNISTEWFCCDGKKPTTFQSVPTVNGLNIPGTPADTNKLDYTGKLIQQIPSWLDGYDSSKAKKLYDLARQISYLPYTDLRASLQTYYNVFARAEGSTEALSKVYLLLRVLYILPEAADVNTVKVFGGFINPDVEQSATAFNVSWPVKATGYGKITVSGKFEGYIGAPYDAVAEADYFNSSFPRRLL